MDLKHVMYAATGIVLLVTPCHAETRVATINLDEKEIAMNHQGTATQTKSAQPTTADAVRPFNVNIPQAALDDLRRRILATNWPEKEPVADASQGVQLA